MFQLLSILLLLIVNLLTIRLNFVFFTSLINKHFTVAINEMNLILIPKLLIYYT